MEIKDATVEQIRNRAKNLAKQEFKGKVAIHCDQVLAMIDRLRTAEAKLASMERQEAVASKEIGRWAGLESLHEMPNGSRLYAKPAPADKPEVAVPDDHPYAEDIDSQLLFFWGSAYWTELLKKNPALSEETKSKLLEISNERDRNRAAAPTHSQHSAVSSESLREIIEREADRFFEWPSADKSHVTAVSTKLFAEHIATLYASPNRCQSNEIEGE